jgi:hypothetical protein
MMMMTVLLIPTIFLPNRFRFLTLLSSRPPCREPWSRTATLLRPRIISVRGRVPERSGTSRAIASTRPIVSSART